MVLEKIATEKTARKTFLDINKSVHSIIEIDSVKL